MTRRPDDLRSDARYAVEHAFSEYLDSQEHLSVSPDLVGVLGASTELGLGRAVGRNLSKRRCNVAFAARQEEAYQKSTEGLDGLTVRIDVDLTDDEQIDRSVEALANMPQFKDGQFKRLHLVPAAADGIPKEKSFLGPMLILARESVITPERGEEVREKNRKYLSREDIMRRAIQVNLEGPLKFIQRAKEAGVMDDETAVGLPSSVWSDVCGEYILQHGLQHKSNEELYGLDVPNTPALYNVGVPKGLLPIRLSQMGIKNIDFVIPAIQDTVVGGFLDKLIWPLVYKANPGVQIEPPRITREDAADVVARVMSRPPVDLFLDHETIKVYVKGKGTNVKPPEWYRHFRYPL